MSGPWFTHQIPGAVEAELRAWQERAMEWPLVSDGTMERCAKCLQGVIRVRDDAGNAYRYSPAARLVLIVAHLRQVHDEH
jgi:hypothetical protein